MKQLLVLSILAFASVQSASYYARIARESDIAAIPEVVKEAIADELKASEIQVVVEPEPKPIVKESLVDPIEPSRIAEPAVGVQEPSAIVVEVKPKIESEVVPAVPAVPIELRDDSGVQATTQNPYSPAAVWAALGQLTSNFQQNLANTFRLPTAQSDTSASPVSNTQAVQSDTSTNRPGGIFGWFNNNNNNNAQPSTADQNQNQNPNAIVAAFQNAQKQITQALNNWQNTVTGFVRPPAQQVQAAPVAQKLQESSPVTLADEGAPVEENIEEVKAAPQPVAVVEEPNKQNTV